MTFKTKNELSKGCGKDYKNRVKQFGEFIGVISECDEKGLCPTCQSLFQQNKEFIEMIDKLLEKYRRESYYRNNKKQFSIIKDLEELKSLIIGSEEKK